MTRQGFVASPVTGADAQTPISAPIIAQCNDIDLVYRVRLFRDRTLRDIFVSLSRDPLGFLLKKKDRLHVLRKVSLNIYRGDRIGILGFNGAGKTSLCRCFANVYTPNSGKIKVFGRTRAVFDTSVGIYPELTGRENAEILAQFMYPDVSDSERKQLILEALEFSELGNFVDAPFKTYSNGMQARLCLSIISCRSPDLLILDEVFDGADKFFREKVSHRIVQLIENSGAVMFVSHSPEQVDRICNRVIVIHDGLIAFDGPKDDGIKYFNSLKPRATIG